MQDSCKASGDVSRLGAVLYLLRAFCAVAPLLWPKTCFALVWVAFFLVTEPLNYHCGWPSLVRLHEKGDDRKITALLVAGVICGLLWETWNWKAISKWVYSVPFFDKDKFFEMPYVGLMGFPPFAVECWVMFQTFRGIWNRLPLALKVLCVVTLSWGVIMIYQQMDPNHC